MREGLGDRISQWFLGLRGGKGTCHIKVKGICSRGLGALSFLNLSLGRRCHNIGLGLVVHIKSVTTHAR